MIAVIGSTGSIGTQALEVIRNIGEKVTVLTTNKNVELLQEQINEFKPEIAVVIDAEAGEKLKNKIAGGTEILFGSAGLIAAAGHHKTKILLNAAVGSAGLMPTLEAIKTKKNIALANKETLVAAGELVMREAKKNGVKIIPVDSEHSAIFQCLHGNKAEVNKIYLTASGGPFRGMKKKRLESVTPEEALKHPKWKMGKKITVDSATLMNKGLELIEAVHLFGITPDKIKILIHPQSVIHSMVEFTDGAIMAQLGAPDMRVPIQYAITYPERMPAPFGKINFFESNSLTFEAPDYETFECLSIAERAVKQGGTMPAVMSMANEIAVGLFLENKIKFTEIPEIIRRAMDSHKIKDITDADSVLKAEEWTVDFLCR